MTGALRPLRVVVVGGGELADQVRGELARVVDEGTEISLFDGVGAVEKQLPNDLEVPLVVVLPGPGPIDQRIDALAAIGRLRGARVLLLISSGEHADVARAVDEGRIDAFVALPMTQGFLGQHASSQIARWLRLHHPGALPVLDADAASPTADAPRSELLRDMEASSHVVEGELVAAIERALGPRPRLHLPAGVRLTRQGRSVDGVFVVLSGRVALTRHTEAEDLLLHHASTGPVVGLLSLSRSQKAFFTSTTTTDVVVIHLSIEQLDRALALDPEVGAALAAVAIRGFAARLLRSEQLQVERNDLNIELEKERASLARALKDLEAARLELIAQARFATLGELAAGLAHELNNPVAALTRSADHLAGDLTELLGSHPEAAFLTEMMESARTRSPRSTAEERRLRRELEAITDQATAWRLVAAGITGPAQARAVLAQGEAGVDRFELASRIGAQLRGISVATRRITTLVTSLRSYARPDDEIVADIDVAETLDDTLHLVSHRLRDVEIDRDYRATRRIAGHPSQLGQVWTNVLVNAAEALADHPPAGGARVTIAAFDHGEDHVRVTIADNGPGIPASVLPQVFQPHFTTKHGTVRFGLGLGLGLAAHIVHEHDGEIDIESAPGGTIVIVDLPATKE
ncbi:hypothetical protein BSZ39_00155 [Bowdeniella nasicola]|uniref:histidine kinase n=1 Tax=Bowdeniella nasicola TaxID=208480 RepID=A0A1Q5Q5U3_9ACTO|nr:ATP-binding protein [Bowdeniella nasicola]OKL55153.1 hypothetical protein BSZ39_00155 [Bowdeniella nasicola]